MLTLTTSAYADSRRTAGIGLSPLYHGLGVNIGKQSDDALVFISTGCPAIGYGGSTGWIYSCGLGAGFIKTGHFNTDPNFLPHRIFLVHIKFFLQVLQQYQ